MTILFKTVVGSHAWNMQRPDSDIDIFEGYIVPTKDILSGILRQNSHFTAGEAKDESRHEIGVIIEQLLKGNFNFMVGVCSPITEEDKYGYLAELRDIVKRNLAKNIYHSTMGLAYHNYKKYILNNESRIAEYDNVNGKLHLKESAPKKILTPFEIQKKTNQVVRSLMFGHSILKEGKINYYQITDQETSEIQYWMNRLDEAYKLSELPEKPDPTEFRSFLYRLRMDELNNSLLTQVWV